MDCAEDCLIHGRFLVRYNNRLMAVAPRLDHAAFIIMAGFVANRVAEVHIDSPDSITEPVKCCLHDAFHMIRKLLATLNIAVCSNLDQHR